MIILKVNNFFFLKKNNNFKDGKLNFKIKSLNYLGVYLDNMKNLKNLILNFSENKANDIYDYFKDLNLTDETKFCVLCTITSFLEI
jgi:hypothetical protein